MAALAGNPGEKGGVPEGPTGHRERLGCDVIKGSRTLTLGSPDISF